MGAETAATGVHGAGPDRGGVGAAVIGISTDEVTRVGNKRVMPYEQPVYPLIGLGLDRQACRDVITQAGLPVPGKSACYFCPFHRGLTWAEQRRDEPDLFHRSVLLERTLNARRQARHKDPVYLTRFGKPLDEAIPEAQGMLPIFAGPDQGGACDDGYCWT